MPPEVSDLNSPMPPGQPLRDRVHIRVLALQHTVIDPNRKSSNVRDSYWRLYVNNRDGAGLHRPGGHYPLTPRRIHFVPAWVEFGCRCVRPVGHFYIHFDLVGVPGTLVREVFDAPVTLPRLPRLELLASRIARRLARPQRDDMATMFEGKSLLYEALAEIIRRLPPDKSARFHDRAIDQQPIAPAIRHIESRLSEPLRNTDLAKLCHLSPDHFIRRFRGCVGQTPAQYVLERRVALASQRLLFSDDKIERIADDCGFANRFYFSRIFARVMGVSPAAYRKTTRV